MFLVCTPVFYKNLFIIEKMLSFTNFTHPPPPPPRRGYFFNYQKRCWVYSKGGGFISWNIHFEFSGVFIREESFFERGLFELREALFCLYSKSVHWRSDWTIFISDDQNNTEIRKYPSPYLNLLSHWGLEVGNLIWVEGVIGEGV